MNVELRFPFPADVRVQWLVDEADHDRAMGAELHGLALNPAALVVRDASQETPFDDLLERDMHRAIPATAEEGDVAGGVDFPEPRMLMRDRTELFRVPGFRWGSRVVIGRHEFSVGLGIGGLVAELVLRTLDGGIHRVFSNKHIAEFGFDETGRVVAKPRAVAELSVAAGLDHGRAKRFGANVSQPVYARCTSGGI